MKAILYKYISRKSGTLKAILLTLVIVISHVSAFATATKLTPIGSTLSNVTNSDDSYQEVSITSVFPSGIRFGGTVYTSMYVGSNGYVTFGHGNSGYSPQGIQAYTRGPIIAAQYDDLDPRKGGDIYYSQNTDYVVATYVGVYPYSSNVGAGVYTEGVNFQIILRRPDNYSSPNNLDFQIEIRYQNIGWAKSGNNSAWPTAGWSAGDRATYSLLPYSGSSSFISNENASNIGVSGVFRWDVIGGIVQSAPTVNQTKAATSISSSTASSGGNVSSDGGLEITERGVVWNTTGSPTISSYLGKTSDGNAIGSFNSNLSGLSTGTTYYVRAYATNSLGTSYGPQINFTTPSVVPPSVVTNAVSASTVTTTTATGSGYVSNNGGGSITGYGIVCSTSSNPTSNSSGISVSASGTSDSFSGSISGLQASTTYYTRTYASNAAGTGWGTTEAFVTDHIVTYTPGTNGTISGTTSQTIDHGGSGTAVTAVPDANYHFINWSDGSTANPRTDTNVTSSKSLTANFAINKLAFTVQPSQTRAGVNIPFTVKIIDSYGNTMTNSDQDITIAIQSNGGGGTLAGTLTITASGGVIQSGNVWINRTGSYTLNATAGSLTSAVSSSFTVIPAALVDYFTVTGITDPHMAGETTSPTVTAYDEYDNVKYDYTGTVTFSTDNESVSQTKPTVLPSNYTFSLADQGVKTFTNEVSLKQYGDTYYVKVNDVSATSATGQQNNISVTSAELNYYEISVISNYASHPETNNILAGTGFSVLPSCMMSLVIKNWISLVIWILHSKRMHLLHLWGTQL